MNNPTNMWQLVARHLSHEATEEESRALEKIMEEDPCLQFSMEVLTHFWESNDQQPVAKKMLEKQLERQQQQNGGQP